MNQYTGVTLEQRYWARVQKADSGCWLWLGVKNMQGYGQILAYDPRFGRKRAVRIGVVSWFLKHGEWPAAHLDICHHCDTPECVRPDHLFLGTASDNFRDAIRKGRAYLLPPPPRGEANPSAKLTMEKASDIRRLYADGTARTDLAREYGVSLNTISMVVTNRRYQP